MMPVPRMTRFALLATLALSLPTGCARGPDTPAAQAAEPAGDTRVEDPAPGDAQPASAASDDAQSGRKEAPTESSPDARAEAEKVEEPAYQPPPPPAPNAAPKVAPKVALSTPMSQKTAEEFKRAQALFENRKFLECGKQYTALYSAHETSPDADMLAYNAAVCFEMSRRLSPAVRMYKRVVQGHPKSKLAGPSMLRLGHLYGAVAWYDRAAEQLGRYGKRMGKTPEAWDAMRTALSYRLALGDNDKAKRLYRFMDKRYGRQKTREMALVAFAMLDLHERSGDERALEKALTAYIRKYGKRGDPDRLLMAHAKLGALYWRRSCTGTEVDGICAQSVSVARARDYCGPGDGRVLRPAKRRAKDVKKAQKHFKTAAALAGRIGSSGPLMGWAREAAASARFHLAEPDFESALGIAMPTDLDFMNDRKRSSKRFQTWLQKRTRDQRDIERAYQQVVRLNSTEWGAAAILRIGTLYQHMGDELRYGPIPANINTGQFARDKRTAYCDVLTGHVQALDKKADDARKFCLGLGQKTRTHNRFTQACRDALARAEAGGKTHLRELFGRPERTPAPVSHQGKDPSYWAGRVKAEPLSAEHRLARAAALLSKVSSAQGRARRQLLADARQEANAALGINPSDVRGLVTLALIDMEHPGLDARPLAVFLLDQARMIDPKYAQVWNVHGVVAARQGHWARAGLAFERALSINGKSVSALLNGAATSLQVADYPRAYERFGAALRILPKNYDAWLGLGVAHRGKDELAKAQNAYKTAAKLDPGRLEATLNLAILHGDYLAPAASDGAQKRTHLTRAIELLEQSLTKLAGTPNRKDVAAPDIDAAIDRLKAALAALP